MCIVCRDWNLGKLTAKEALRNLGELISGASKKEKKHYLWVSSKILDKEVKSGDTNEELDRIWFDETKDD